MGRGQFGEWDSVLQRPGRLLINGALCAAEQLVFVVLVMNIGLLLKECGGLVGDRTVVDIRGQWQFIRNFSEQVRAALSVLIFFNNYLIR